MYGSFLHTFSESTLWAQLRHLLMVMKASYQSSAAFALWLPLRYCIAESHFA